MEQRIRQISFRADDELIEKLDKLVEMTGMRSRQRFFTEVINAEYDRWMGNPQLLAIVEQMKVLEGQLKEYSNR